MGMMLMKCCPCLRPPPHPLDDFDFDSDDEDDWSDASTPRSTPRGGGGKKKPKQDPKKLRSIMSSQEMDVPGASWEVVHGDEGDYWWNKITGETSWEDPTKTRRRGQTTVSVV